MHEFLRSVMPVRHGIWSAAFPLFFSCLELNGDADDMPTDPVKPATPVTIIRFIMGRTAGPPPPETTLFSGPPPSGGICGIAVSWERRKNKRKLFFIKCFA